MEYQILRPVIQYLNTEKKNNKLIEIIRKKNNSINNNLSSFYDKHNKQ